MKIVTVWVSLIIMNSKCYGNIYRKLLLQKKLLHIFVHCYANKEEVRWLTICVKEVDKQLDGL